MSYAVVGQDIVDRARQRANMLGDDALDFWSEPQLLAELNGSIAFWYDMVRTTTWGGQYYRSDQPDFDTVPTQSTYDLAADFLSLLSIDCYVTTGSDNGVGVIAALPYQEEERNAFKWYPGMFGARGPVYYQLQGSKVSFIPQPTAAVRIRIHYVPTAPRLTDLSQSIDTINAWEEWIICDLAIKMLTADGGLDVIGVLANERARQEQRIKDAAAARDTTTAEIVHDVENLNREWPF